MEKHKLEVGGHVIYITPDRVAVNALVEVVHADYSLSSDFVEAADKHREKYGQWPCINLIYIQPDPAMKDQHGRQKGHASSCSHGNVQGVPQGYCWLFRDELPDNVEIGQQVIFNKPV